MEPIWMRGVERILAVAVGGLTVYLGYRLFLTIPNKSSQGKIALPGGISIYMTRIGPGAFFAVFGAIVVAMSFYFSITVTNQTDKTQHTASKASHYSGFAPSVSELELQEEIHFINSILPTLLKADLPATRRDDLEVHCRQLKLGLLRLAWKDNWGNFENFQIWVNMDTKAPPPRGLEKAAKYFNHGKE